MKTQRKSKFLALLLSLAVVFSSLPFAAISASAAELPAEVASVSDDAILEADAEDEMSLEANDAQEATLLGANNTEEVSADTADVGTPANDGTPDTKSANLCYTNSSGTYSIAGIDNPKQRPVTTSSDMTHVALGYANNAAGTTTPVTYRVLRLPTSTSTHLLLDCDKVFSSKQYYNNSSVKNVNWSTGDYYSNIYENVFNSPSSDSNLYIYDNLDGYRITKGVWNAISRVSSANKTEDLSNLGLSTLGLTQYDNSLNHEKLHCLRYYDIQRYYGYQAGASFNGFSYLGKTGINGETNLNWWLRTSLRYMTGFIKFNTGAGYVCSDRASVTPVNNSNVGVSPALVFNISKITFTLANSVAQGHYTGNAVDVPNTFEATKSVADAGQEANPWILGVQTTNTNLEVGTTGTAYSITIPNKVTDGTKLRVFAYEEYSDVIGNKADRTLHTTPLTEITGVDLKENNKVTFNLSNIPYDTHTTRDWKVAAVLTNSNGTVVAFGDADKEHTITVTDPADGTKTISVCDPTQKISATCKTTKLTYTSSDESILKVKENGQLLPYGVGEATVTITAPATGGYVETTKKVTVKVENASISVAAQTSFPTYYEPTATNIEINTTNVYSGKRLTLEWTDADNTPTGVDVDPITVKDGKAILQINTSDKTQAGEYPFRIKCSATQPIYSYSVFKVNKATATDYMKSDSENLQNGVGKSATVQLPVLSDGNTPTYSDPVAASGMDDFNSCFTWEYDKTTKTDLHLALKKKLTGNVYKFYVPVKGEKNYEDYNIEITINLTDLPTIQLDVENRIVATYADPIYKASYAKVISPTDDKDANIELTYTAVNSFPFWWQNRVISVDSKTGYIKFLRPGTAKIKVVARDLNDGYKTDTEYVYVTVNKKPVARPTGTDFTYDGTKKTGVLEGEGYTLSGTISATNAGTYTAKATLLDNYCWSDGSTDREEDITWSIAQKEISICSAEIASKTYDRTNTATVTDVLFDGLEQGDTLINGTDYTASGVFAVVTATDSANVDVSVELKDTVKAKNYTLTTPTCIETAPILKKEVGVTWTNLKLTYNGKAQSPTAVPTGIVDGDNCEITVKGKAKDVGDEYVAITTGLTGEDFGNYKLKNQDTTEFSIVPADLEMCASATDIPAQTYTGDKITPPVTVTDLRLVTDATLKEGKDYTVTYASNTNVATATAIVTGIGNYTGKIEPTFEITKATVTDTKYTTDEESIANTPNKTAIVQLPVLPDGKTPTYSTPTEVAGYATFTDYFSFNYDTTTASDLHLTLEKEFPTTQTDYKFKVTASDPNYNNYDIVVTMHLTASDPIVLDVPDKIEITYSSDTDYPSNVKVTFPTGVDVTTTYSVKYGSDVISVNTTTGRITTLKAGNAVIQVTATCSGYASDTELIPVIVKKKQIARPTVTDLTYDGTAKTGVKSGEGYTLGGTVTATDAGTYYATATPDHTKYEWEDGSEDTETITWSIAKCEIIPNVTVAEKTYDGTNTATVTNVTFTNLVTGTTLTSGTDYIVSAVFADVKANDSAKANVTIALNETDTTKNYKLNDNEFDVTSKINKMKIGIDWDEDNLEFTYDGKDHAPTAIAKGYIDGDDCDVTVNGATKNAGPHTATATNVTGTDCDNYELSGDNLTTTFTILKATVAINDLFDYATPTDLIYNKTAKEAKVTTKTDIHGVAISGVGKLTVKYYDDANKEATPTDVGTYVVKASMATGTNYEAIPESKIGSFEITPKPVKVSTWTDTKFTYDGEAHKPTATSTEFIGEDKNDCGIEVSGEQTNAGGYIATATSITGLRGNNYIVSDTDAKSQTPFTIDKTSSTNLPKSVTADIVNAVGSTVKVTMPDSPTGGCTFGTPSTNSNIELSTPTSDGLATAKVTKTLAVGSKYEITVPVTATNYTDYVVTVTLTAVPESTPKKEAESEKDVQDAISKGGDVEIKKDITLESELDVKKDSTISGNGQTLTVGDGIKVEDGITLTVNNSNIVSENGKTALTLNNGANAVLEAVKISKSKSDTGAVNVSAGSTLTVKAGTNITDNTASNGQSACNVYLGEGGTIDTSNLKASDASTTKIGITSSVAPTADKPVVIGGASTEDVSKCFVSDDDRYEIIDYIPDTQANADEVLHYVALALKDTPEPTPTKNGWVQTDGKWQYYKDDKFLTDWHNDIPGWEGQWFYFDNTTGYSKSAWANDIHGWEGQWFYFNPNTCVMMKNWVYDGGTRFFYLDDNTGVMKKGWNFLNWSGGANWFCFSNDGICYTNTVTPDGYRVDQNGVWVQ